MRTGTWIGIVGGIIGAATAVGAVLATAGSIAIYIVAGIVITFEMGLNWGAYAAKTGPVIGPIIGMEVVTAFFVEAGFIGVLLYGDGRVNWLDADAFKHALAESKKKAALQNAAP